jgi:hypothetical protein
MSRRTKALAASFEFAVEMIKSKIDGEQKFVPDAPYEMTGEALKEYLAFAYREGMNYGASKVSPLARGRGTHRGGPVATSGQSSEEEAKQKPTPGEPRIGSGSTAQFLRRLDGGPKGPRPLKDP